MVCAGDSQDPTDFASALPKKEHLHGAWYGGNLTEIICSTMLEELHPIAPLFELYLVPPWCSAPAKSSSVRTARPCAMGCWCSACCMGASLHDGRGVSLGVNVLTTCLWP